jgi:drug/metabolite transporter (DMT)-like permease
VAASALVVAKIMFERLLPWTGLAYMGVAWGLSFSLAKLASIDGTTPIGIAFWQSLLAGCLLLGYVHLRGRRLSMTWPAIRLYLIVALLGTAVPSACFYYAAARVPAGILAITVTLVPILTYGLALLLRSELFSASRLTGIMLGALAIVLLVGPENSLPEQAALPWVLLACFSSLCYAIENIYLAQRGTEDVGAIRLACGMNLFAAVILAFAGLATDQLFMLENPLGIVELSIIALAIINATAYSAFVACIAYSGPLFASQVGYVVTLAGVFWGIAIFDESHSIWVWTSLVTMLVGLMLVSPRKHHT